MWGGQEIVTALLLFDLENAKFSIFGILSMKWFRTGSPAIVAECQLQFNFLPLLYQVDIRTAKFLFRFINSANSLCTLLSVHAKALLTSLLSNYGEGVLSIYDLRVAICDLLVA